MSEHTTTYTEDPSELSPINGVKVKNKNYLVNYEKLKNKPAWINKTVGDAIFENVSCTYMNEVVPGGGGGGESLPNL